MSDFLSELVWVKRFVVRTEDDDDDWASGSEIFLLILKLVAPCLRSHTLLKVARGRCCLDRNYKYRNPSGADFM